MMAVFTISDLHLAHRVPKPMEVFGWRDYTRILREHWIREVGEEDTVFLPGDFSWATYLKEAQEDFAFLDGLPGKKILLKGNHDFWWETVTKMEHFLQENGMHSIRFLHNNSYCIEGKHFCGTKGWDTEKDSEKIILRETHRFRMSLESRKGEGPVIGVFHYPPFFCEGIMKLIREHGIGQCIYGHLHGAGESVIRQNGTEFLLASCDHLGFKPLRIG